MIHHQIYPSSRPLRDIFQQYLRSHPAQIVRRQRRIASQHITITVRLARHLRVDNLNTILAQLLADQPRQLAWSGKIVSTNGSGRKRHIQNLHVTNVDICSRVERIGEHHNLVALVDELAAFWLADIS